MYFIFLWVHVHPLGTTYLRPCPQRQLLQLQRVHPAPFLAEVELIPIIIEVLAHRSIIIEVLAHRSIASYFLVQGDDATLIPVRAVEKNLVWWRRI
jgi:hypothetical protein